MEKSNDRAERKTPEDSHTLMQVNRRLEVSKSFFAWIATGYFLSTLFTIGGLWSDLFAPISKGMIGVLAFACGSLAYSLYAYWAMVQGGIWYRARFGVLFVLVVIFVGALARQYGSFL